MNDKGDVVLIYLNEKPAFFARIDSINPDVKKGWFTVQFLSLTIPLRNITWILREEYINGVPFTMDGNPVRIEAVKAPFVQTDLETTKEGSQKNITPHVKKKVIPFRKKQDKT